VNEVEFDRRDRRKHESPQSLKSVSGSRFELDTSGMQLREEHRLRVFENRVLRRIFCPKREEVTEEWKKLRNEEFHNFYSSLNIIRMIKSRRMGWASHVARMGEKRNAYRILVAKPEGRRPVGRPRRRWVDNIKID
jgi:hypothetical protein